MNFSFNQFNEFKKIWARFIKVKSLKFYSNSSHSSQNGNGMGNVIVTAYLNKYAITFEESGSWTTESQQTFQFNNQLSWSFIANTEPSKNAPFVLRLEHLRYSQNSPVLLAVFKPKTANIWEAKAPFVCGKDTYKATVSFTKTTIKLSWHIKGPNKDTHIQYTYT